MTTTSQSSAPPVPSGVTGPPPASPDWPDAPDSPDVPAPREDVPPRARWERPALGLLLAATALLYLWNLSASGYANEFYAAAAQAGATSWKAFFFAASDAAASITVDKTPASVWVMAASVRIFGLNSWAILAPQALMGVGTVALLYGCVRRWYGAGAGLVAGAVLALTPVAVLMFRFNNPDALLVLSLVAAAYATVRGVEVATSRAGTWWFVLAGSLVGLGFLAKMLQAVLVLPAFALVVLIAAPGPLRRRIGQVLAAGAGLVVAAGWWVAVVELTPQSWRPYIGGSQTNSVWELTLGYNGLGRLTGAETGSVGGGNGWGETGLLRMFGGEIAGQAAWLLPAALLLLVTGVVVAGRRPRTDRERAGFVLWGAWLLVTGLVFSLMAGIFHAYYTVALAPAIGALVGMGSAVLWRHRHTPWAGPVLAAAVVASSWWAWLLLGRSPEFLPWLRTAILLVGPVAAVVLLVVRYVPARLATAAAGLALVAVLAGPASYAVQTAATAHGGSIPTAGPTVAGARGGPGGMGAGQRGPGAMPGQAPAQTPAQGGLTPGQASLPGGPGGFAGGMGAGMGGLLGGSSASAEVVALLQHGASSYRWVAATVASQNAASYQLAAQASVMPIGGFNGSDPSPTLEQFQAWVAAGEIHYYIGGQSGGPGSGSGSTTSAQIASWVAETFEAETVDGVTLYDLSATP